MRKAIFALTAVLLLTLSAVPVALSDAASAISSVNTGTGEVEMVFDSAKVYVTGTDSTDPYDNTVLICTVGSDVKVTTKAGDEMRFYCEAENIQSIVTIIGSYNGESAILTFSKDGWSEGLEGPLTATSDTAIAAGTPMELLYVTVNGSLHSSYCPPVTYDIVAGPTFNGLLDDFGVSLDSISSVRFCSLRDDLPSAVTAQIAAGTALDASYNGDGTILIGHDGYDFYIVLNRGSGTIAFNADSSGMFRDLKVIQYFGVSDSVDIDTSSVTDMGSMFNSAGIYAQYRTWATEANELITCFDTSNVTNMSNMFYRCGMRTLDLSSFRLDSSPAVTSMFFQSKMLETVDLTGWDSSKISDVTNIFNGCSKLEKIFTSYDFDLTGKTGMSVFNDISRIEGYYEGHGYVNGQLMYGHVDRADDIGYFTIRHNATLDANGGQFEDGSEIINVITDKVRLDYAPTMESHDLFKWNTCADGSGTDYAIGSTVGLLDIGDITLYAQWKVIGTFELVLDANGGTFPGGETTESIITTEHTFDISGIDDPSRDGFFFLGWAYSSTASVPDFGWYDKTVPGDADVRLYAVWTASSSYELKAGPQFNSVFDYPQNDGNSLKHNTEKIVFCSESDYDFSQGFTRIGDLSIENGGVALYKDSDDIAYVVISGASGTMFFNPDSTCMFQEFSHLLDIEVKPSVTIDTSNVTNMSNMFTLVGRWNVGSFSDCSDLISRFDTSRVTDMSFMFSQSIIYSLDLSGFDVSNVTNLDHMFYGMALTVHGAETMTYGIVSLDLTGWEVDSLTYAAYLFANDIELRTIYCTVDFREVLDGSSGRDLLTNCTSIVGGAGTTYSSGSYSYGHVDGAGGSPGYFTDRNA